MLPKLIVPIPSLRTSGGNLEIVRLVQEIADTKQVDVLLASMWRHPNEIDTGAIPTVHLHSSPPDARRAWLQLPAILLAFWKLIRSLQHHGASVTLLLGHYSTYPLAWMLRSLPRICFTQDMEWLFVLPGWRRRLLKAAILRTNCHARVITTNWFVTQAYLREGVQLFGQASIWADPMWLAEDLPSAVRDIDVLMLVRSSGVKRLDLYRIALAFFREHTDRKVAVITPDPEIASLLSGEVGSLYLRPTNEGMRELYARSRTFLLLSDVEGFGLPPLEAMGSGCVPICRDSGGVRCYMHGEFAPLLMPLDVPIARLVENLDVRIRAGHLPTPAAAHAVFQVGLEQSRASRAKCVERLRDLLRSEAPKA